MTAPPVRHLNQIELSRRWSLSHRTLERWRWEKRGPVYLKIGGRVAYRLEDVEAFERDQIHVPLKAGPLARARAMPTRFRIPPLRSAGMSSILSSKPTN